MKIAHFLYITALSATVLLSGCNNKINNKGIIPEETMVDIMHEACLLEGYFALKSNYRYDTLGPEMVACYDSLLSKYDVSYQLFDSSLTWYTHHPDIFARITDSVTAWLDRDMTEFESNVGQGGEEESDSTQSAEPTVIDDSEWFI